MSATRDEIDELSRKIDYLAEAIGIKFEYQWDELTGFRRKDNDEEIL